ncbi:MAG TPA: hypothetical protein VII92_16880, partial [Anaerolineae bacterium]
DLIEQADTLSPEDQLRLANHLVQRVLQNLPVAKPQRKWREIRGMAKPSLFGEDAQAYISRTRREGDEHRAQTLRGTA